MRAERFATSLVREIQHAYPTFADQDRVAKKRSGLILPRCRGGMDANTIYIVHDERLTFFKHASSDPRSNAWVGEEIHLRADGRLREKALSGFTREKQ